MEKFKSFITEQKEEPYKIICFFHVGDSSRDVAKTDQIGMMKTMNKAAKSSGIKIYYVDYNGVFLSNKNGKVYVNYFPIDDKTGEYIPPDSKGGKIEYAEPIEIDIENTLFLYRDLPSDRRHWIDVLKTLEVHGHFLLNPFECYEICGSKYLTDEQATQTLLNNIEGEPLTKPRIIKFRTGQRHQHWNKNCVALGLAAGFLEPLESTSIHLIQRGIIRLLQLFPTQGISQTDVDEFNAHMKEEFLNVRDFIVLHYHVTEREDTPFWRHCKSMKIPETLAHRVELFKQSGRIFQKDNDVFAENSWSQVMLGQGILPEQYHPIVNMMSDEELVRFLNGIKGSVNNVVDQLPTHQQFIDSYCKAPSM